MDKNGKLFGKISILDIFVVLLVIGVVAGTFYRYTSERTNMLFANDTIHYTLRISNVREFSLENYHVGLRAYHHMTNELVGTIVGIRSEPVYDFLENAFGELYLAPRLDIINIYLDLEVVGMETDTAYLINGTHELNIGADMRLRTRYITVTGTIDSIRII